MIMVRGVCQKFGGVLGGYLGVVGKSLVTQGNALIKTDREKLVSDMSSTDSIYSLVLASVAEAGKSCIIVSTSVDNFQLRN